MVCWCDKAVYHLLLCFRLESSSVDLLNEIIHGLGGDITVALQSMARPQTSTDRPIFPIQDIETYAVGKRRWWPNGGSTKETDLLSASDPRRIQVDNEQIQALIRKLDSEK